MKDVRVKVISIAKEKLDQITSTYAAICGVLLINEATGQYRVMDQYGNFWDVQSKEQARYTDARLAALAQRISDLESACHALRTNDTSVWAPRDVDKLLRKGVQQSGTG